MNMRFGCVLAALLLVSGCFEAGNEDSNRDSGATEADIAVGDAAVGDTATDTSADDTALGDISPDGTSTVSDSSDDGVGDECPTGQTICGGECVDVQVSPDHCGTCGRRCEPQGVHSVAGCASGSCSQTCEAGWSDLDGDQATGCELECETTNSGDEICDGLDNNCDGVIDDGFSTGPCTVGVGACEMSGEYVCADAQTAACGVSGGMPSDETCSDGIDNDCDGAADEDDAVDATMWFGDTDGDGFGDANVSAIACDAPQDYVDNDTDCDDTDASAYASVDGYAEQDGDGYTAGGALSFCTDGSLPTGYVASQSQENDCDDASAAINPGADEVCGDQTDNDCDGGRDDASAVDATLWYVDCDGDGYSGDTAGSRTACVSPSASLTGCNSSSAGWTGVRPDGGGSSTDCNDEVSEMHPGQTAWFDEPVTAFSVQTKDWDYNCDGSRNLRWTNTRASCEARFSGLACPSSGSAGWEFNNVIGCGGVGSYQNCETSGHNCIGRVCQSYFCDSSIAQRPQECH
jgi:hypothetical protein